ncbi:monovalent cation/H(+) antiporter subunit G [bacterium]|nr:monovalent cation/H(+) antiporter subunit G [bacterium]
MTDTLGLIFILIGVLFDLFGCIGLVRLPDIYNRLQAATKCVTLGTCMILFGLFVITGISSAGILSLLCALFVLFTSPVGAHALARAAHRYGIKLWDGSVTDKYADIDRPEH